MNKLKKNTYPLGHGPDDLECFGPPALEDGKFDECKIADMGCFTQDGKDSNKYYHGAITKSKKTGEFVVYYEWGRVGATSPAFQCIVCSSEAEARKIFAAQMHEKNDGRGEWCTLGTVKTLRAKKDKDCYLVRPMATRNTGLPDAKRIQFNEGTKSTPTSTKPGRTVDDRTMQLLKDLSIATVAYTKGVMANDSLPTQKSIDEARTILTEALKRIAIVTIFDDQVKDKELVQYSKYLYGRIPKKKPLHSGPEKWMLSEKNILIWQDDLNAFESALYSSTHTSDPLAGLPIQMEWVDPKSKVGAFLYEWWPSATANRHGNVGSMRIKNLWKVERHGDETKFQRSQEEILSSKCNIKDRPLFQPTVRADLSDSSLKRYKNSNTALLFHGTRSVNVSGILQEHFRLPKELVGVTLTAAMFGHLIYMADDWKKSAGYTSLKNSYWASGNGGVEGRDAFMFACDVACGNAFVASEPYGYTSPPNGHHSIFGKGGHTKMKQYGDGCLKNNEWIVSRNEQINIRYLAEFSA
jgi:hypothetical protein